MPTQPNALEDTCSRCGATWTRSQQRPKPKRCRKCKSYWWDDPGHRGPGRPRKEQT